MKVQLWASGGLVFASILAVHLFVGHGQARNPAKFTGWVDKVGISFNAAVTRAIPESIVNLPKPSIRAPASTVPSDVKNAQF